MIKRLLLTLSLVFLGAPTFAVTRTAVANGLWSATATWSGAVVPVAGDDVVIDNDSVVLDSAAACAGGASACGQTLTIGANSTLVMGRGATFLWINCATATDPCINVTGTLIGGAGQTLAIGSDGGAGNLNPDRIRVNSGGRLSWQGQRLHAGTITSIVTDEATISNPNLAFGLPTRDFVFEDTAARFPMTIANAQEWASADDCVNNCYVVRFTSGERAWRSYNLKATATNPTIRLTVDYDSRSNPASVTAGIGIAAQATAKADGYGRAYVTGTAAVSSQTVTGTGTSWNSSFALGSRWYCDSDTQTASKRIVRVVSTTSIILESAYGGAGCGATAAYHIVDDNQPYPFMDHSEHIRPGDGYEVFRPANILGAVITTGAEPDGSSSAPMTNIECVTGSVCQFGYTAIRWVGGYATLDTNPRNAGVVLTATKALVDTEIKGSAATFMVMMLDSQGTEMARNFIHYLSPTLPCQGCGHGVVWEATNQSTPTVQVGNRMHDNRIELTADDTTWVRAPQSNWRRTGNITKYIGTTLVTETANCVEYGGYVGTGANPTGTHYFKDAIDSDNICMNYGSLGCSITNEYTGGGCSGIAWRTQGSKGGTGYRNDIGISRNLVANSQTGGGIEFEGPANPQDTQVEFDNNSVTIAGNFVGFTAMDGIGGAQGIYNNVVLSWGLDRQANNSTSMAGISFVPRAAKGNITIPVDENIATPNWVGVTVVRSGMFLPPMLAVTGNTLCLGAGNPDTCCSGVGAGTCPKLGYEANPVISDNVIFGHGYVLMIGNSSGQAMNGNPIFQIQNNYVSCELARLPAGDDSQRGIDQWRDGAPTENSGVWTFNVVAGCTGSNLNIRGFATPPAPVENNNYLIHAATAAAGMSPDGSDSLTKNLGWSPLSFDFDRRNDAADTHGPRAVGLLVNPLWKTRVWPTLGGTSAGNAVDTDGDGVGDLYDNCRFTFNPSQLDADGNGKGDAC